MLIVVCITKHESEHWQTRVPDRRLGAPFEKGTEGTVWPLLRYSLEKGEACEQCETISGW